MFLSAPGASPIDTGRFFEGDKLSDTGVAYLHNGFIQVGCGFLFWGFNTVFVVFACFVLISQGLQSFIPGSSARRWLLSIAITMYVASCTMMGIILQQNITFSNQLGPHFTLETQKYLLDLRLVIFWLPKLNYMLSDLVVVWRAWALWPGKWIIRAILASLVPLTLGLTIGCGIPITRHAMNELDWSFTEFTGNTPWQFLCVFPACGYLFTNAFATLCIGIKYWQYRKDTAMVHGSVADILVILTESGFLYCALWILVILVEFKTFNPLTLQVWVAILPQIACMYPMFVILLVFLQKTRHSDNLILMSATLHSADPNTVIGSSDIDYKAFRNSSNHYNPRHSIPSESTFSTMQFGPPERAEVPPPKRNPIRMFVPEGQS